MDNVSKSSVVKQQISDVYHSKPEEEKECISKKISESHLGRSDEEKTDTIAMRKQTNLERYGVAFYVESDEFKSEMLARHKETHPDYGTVKVENYYRKVRSLTGETYKKYKHEIDNDNLRSKEWHLDHIYSVIEGYLNDVPPEVIACKSNLRIIEGKENISKNRRCCITLEALYEEYELNKKAP